VFSSQPPDVVTGQNPAPGDQVIKGSNVRINVSRGAKPVPVPDVTGQPFANAESALRGQGFVVSRVDIQSDQAQGVVVAEDPPPGTEISKGSKITLSVSTGPSSTQVPDVTHQNQASAEALLTGAGLTPAVIYQPVTDPSQDGIVIAQDPTGGSDAKTGEVVTITVGQLGNGTPGGDGAPPPTTTTTATTTTP
jgi:serine/threonine-protein kinase